MKANDLAVLAGQKRLSPRTGFVHQEELIPIYENFCYALALFRQKTKESIHSAFELVEKLLPFQASDGNFPVFLHEYPKCYDYHMGLKVAAIITHFHRMLSKPKWEAALEKALSFQPEKPLWINRVRAIRGEPLLDFEPQTAGEWIEHLISAQIAGQMEFHIPYEPALHLFPLTGQQEQYEPRPSPIEWILAEGAYTSRHLKDHPSQLLCAPLFPFHCIPKPIADPNRIFWQGATLHSLVKTEEAVFCDRSPETEIWVKGKKATTFQLGEIVTIETPQKTIEVRFTLAQGTGDFCGHIFFANRPSQVAKGFEAYDWQIGVRTLRKSDDALLKIEIY